MKKIVCAMSLIAAVALMSGCDNTPIFVGTWKAVSKGDGSALPPKQSSLLTITCSEASCHVIDKGWSILMGKERTEETDWEIKDSSTLMRGNGFVSIYVKGNQLTTPRYIYERQSK